MSPYELMDKYAMVAGVKLKKVNTEQRNPLAIHTTHTRKQSYVQQEASPCTMAVLQLPVVHSTETCRPKDQ